jgi:hypothetical protein
MRATIHTSRDGGDQTSGRSGLQGLGLLRRINVAQRMMRDRIDISQSSRALHFAWRK